jgi:SSS family solute:Na+ symporter
VAAALAKKGQISLPVADQALPTLVGTMLPAGLRGLVVAGLMAALMSSLSSVFNSTSTLVTIDVYKKLKPAASERQLVLFGQVVTAILVGFGLLWIPLMKLISAQLYQYLQSVQAYISPPIAAVFLLGILWKRVNAKGAMAALLSGFVLGAARLIAELNKGSLDGMMLGYASMNFLHFAVFLFVVCTVILVVVSLVTPPPPPEKVTGLTFETRTAAVVAGDPGWRQTDKLLSYVLVAGVFALWWYFR